MIGSFSICHMYLYRYTPRNGHLHTYEAELHQRYLEGKCTPVKCAHDSLKAFKYFEKYDRDWMYFLIDTKLAKKTDPEYSKEPSKVVHGFVSLTKLPRWASHEVAMLYVNPEMRGQGLGALVYDCVLQDKIILVSGSTQSFAARRLWMKLAQNSNYVVWAQDLMNLDRTSLVTVEGGDFDCSFKLYNDMKTKRRKQTEDIRLIAVLNRK